jgi:hypothetical protein
MAENETRATEPAAEGWMSDVQRALALIIIAAISLAMLTSTVRVVVAGDTDSISDMAKTLQAAMVNMGLIALGFFFGNTMAKLAADAGQQKIVDKLTSTNPPGAPGPVAPVSPAPVTPWWSLLTDLEKNVISVNAKDDPRLAAFMTAATVGVANADDLAYLVSKGVLSQDRATAIQAP